MYANEALQKARQMTEQEFNEAFEPQSSDFQDGNDAGGFWVENGTLIEQVVGSSGVYLIKTDIATGETISDSRPWQMRM